jgi:hypothetical protein
MSDVDIIDRQGSPAELARVAAVIASDSRFAIFATSLFAVRLLRLDAKLAIGTPMSPRRMSNILDVELGLLQELIAIVAKPGAETCTLFAYRRAVEIPVV